MTDDFEVYSEEIQLGADSFRVTVSAELALDVAVPVVAVVNANRHRMWR